MDTEICSTLISISAVRIEPSLSQFGKSRSAFRTEKVSISLLLGFRNFPIPSSNFLITSAGLFSFLPADAKQRRRWLLLREEKEV